MSRPSPFQPWPPDPDGDRPERPADDGYVSEFLSEESAEFRAVRRGATEERGFGAAPAPVPVPAAVRDVRAAAQVAPASAASIRAARRAVPWGWLVAVIVLAVAAPAYFIARQRPATVTSGAPAAPASVSGSATIISRPEGAEVVIDGVPRGVTPLKLALPVGNYNVELKNGTSTRSLTLSVDAATATREFVDLAPSAAAAGAAAAPGVGKLEVSTDVPGAGVAVDGVARGVTPLVLAEHRPGPHRVAIRSGGTVVNRTVTVAAGATATVVATVVPAGASGGWVTITSPLELQVLERGRVIGTTAAERLMLPAGPHELELVAAPLEFRTTVTTTVIVGRTVSIRVAIPDGRLSINASPWADVWLDGQPLGSTPLANIVVPIGNHDVVFVIRNWANAGRPCGWPQRPRLAWGWTLPSSARCQSCSTSSVRPSCWRRYRPLPPGTISQWPRLITPRRRMRMHSRI